MSMNLILAICLYPTLLIVFLVMKNVTKGNNRQAFSVGLTKELAESDEMKRIKECYGKQFRNVMILSLILPAICLIPRHVSIQFTLWMLWFCGALVAMAFPYAIANKKVMSLKYPDGGMKEAEEERETQYVELEIIKTAKFVYFLPPILLSILGATIPFFHGSIQGFDAERLARLEVFRYSACIFAVMTILFYLLAVLMDGMKSKVICQDSQINISYNRAKKKIWTDFWLWNGYVNTFAVMLIVATAMLDFHALPVFLLVCGIETFAALYLIFFVSKKLQQVDLDYSEWQAESFDENEERYWIWGMFYNNPHDRRSMVTARFGVGTSMNMATKAGKVILVVGVLGMLTIPIMCIWMLLEDFTPLRVEATETALVCSHLKEDYVIPYDEIDDVSLLTEIPQARSKIIGSNMDTLEKGTFAEASIGRYTAFLNPQEELFIKIEAGQKVYLISSSCEESTRTVYEEVAEIVK